MHAVQRARTRRRRPRRTATIAHDRREHAMLRVPSVELALDRARIADECALDARAPVKARHCSRPSAARIAMKFIADRWSTQKFAVDVAEERRAGLGQPLERDHLAGDDAHALLRACAPARRRGRTHGANQPHRQRRRPPCRPRASSSAVCSTHTCVSAPTSTTCARSVPGRRPRHFAATREKGAWAPRRPPASSSRTPGPSGPRPFGYCSTAATGTPIFCATRMSQTTLAATCSCRRRAQDQLRLQVDDEQRASVRRRSAWRRALHGHESVSSTKDAKRTKQDRPRQSTSDSGPGPPSCSSWSFVVQALPVHDRPFASS